MKKKKRSVDVKSTASFLFHEILRPGKPGRVRVFYSDLQASSGPT
jgi:hypothetical protein